jgi:hypothetical protein
VLVVTTKIISSYQQTPGFPASSQYQIHHHPTSEMFDHQQSLPTSFDILQFNQQAKQLQAHINYFNYQQKQLQHKINSVESEPNFDFVVNGNFTDLEKASEQFVDLGNLMGKKIPAKVVKITKTVAMQKPYPEQFPIDVSHNGNHGIFTPSFKPTPIEHFQSPYKVINPQASEIYQHHQLPFSISSAQSISEYDTEPFFVKTAENETIKIVPVPYYISIENGIKQDIVSASSIPHLSSENESDNFEYIQQTPSQLKNLDDSTKESFHSFTISHHPPKIQNSFASHLLQQNYLSHMENKNGVQNFDKSAISIANNYSFQ